MSNIVITVLGKFQVTLNVIIGMALEYLYSCIKGLGGIHVDEHPAGGWAAGVIFFQ